MVVEDHVALELIAHEIEIGPDASSAREPADTGTPLEIVSPVNTNTNVISRDDNVGAQPPP
jgi:hypothetical protein